MTLGCLGAKIHKQHSGSAFSNTFKPLQELIQESDIETQWEYSKKLWLETCEEVWAKKKAEAHGMDPCLHHTETGRKERKQH